MENNMPKCPKCGSEFATCYNHYDIDENEYKVIACCANCHSSFQYVTDGTSWKIISDNKENNSKDFKTIFNFISDDWKRVKNRCRTTVNKEFTDNEPTEAFKKKLLISEHTPIRLLEIDWSWKKIKSWVSVHWTRHRHEKFVSTQRDDRKEHDISRDDMPQGTLVDMDNYANMQQLIDIFRKRLCHQASPETRALAEDFKVALHERCPEMADVLVSNCIYRNGCPEFVMCKDCYFIEFLDFVHEKDVSIEALMDIQKRYDLYNEWFYENYEKGE